MIFISSEIWLLANAHINVASCFTTVTQYLHIVEHMYALRVTLRNSTLLSITECSARLTGFKNQVHQKA